MVTIGDVSVRPYPSRIVKPHLQKSRIVCGSRRAPPEIIYRRPLPKTPCSLASRRLDGLRPKRCLIIHNTSRLLFMKKIIKNGSFSSFLSISLWKSKNSCGTPARTLTFVFLMHSSMSLGVILGG